MSSTNKTTNYELSQFIGSDKPAWLVDYNQDMTKIDTRMKANADLATSADGKADANTTKIGDLDYLSTTVKTSLVGAVNEVDGKAETAQNTASASATTANTAKDTADSAIAGLQRFNLTNRITLTPSTNRGTINTSVTNVQYAGDSTNSIYKVYGRVYIAGLSGISGNLTVTIGTTPLRPETSYTINTGAIVYRTYTSGTFDNDVTQGNLNINTDGTVTYNLTLNGSNNVVSILIPPCLYFNTDFGDE